MERYVVEGRKLWMQVAHVHHEYGRLTLATAGLLYFVARVWVSLACLRCLFVCLGCSDTSGTYRWRTWRRRCRAWSHPWSGWKRPEVIICSTNGGGTQSRKLCKKLAQVSCASFLHQIFVQVHASSADDTSNKNGRSWTKQIIFSILSVDHSMGTQNFYLNNLNKFKK